MTTVNSSDSRKQIIANRLNVQQRMISSPSNRFHRVELLLFSSSLPPSSETPTSPPLLPPWLPTSDLTISKIPNMWHISGLAIVVMGVSGTGKSTVAEMLAKALGCSFLEADDFHSQANKEKMRNGISLTDEDRFPWLEALTDAIRKSLISGENITLTCSALQKKYREILRSADPDYKQSQYMSCRVRFICLEAPVEVIAERMMRRSKEGKHFMPVSLLQSQLDLLQIDEAEEIMMVDATASLGAIMDFILPAILDYTNSNS